MRRDTSGANGHVTIKPSICEWDVFCKSGVYARKVSCLTAGGLPGVRQSRTEKRGSDSERRAGVSRGHSRLVGPSRRPER